MRKIELTSDEMCLIRVALKRYMEESALKDPDAASALEKIKGTFGSATLVFPEMRK